MFAARKGKDHSFLFFLFFLAFRDYTKIDCLGTLLLMDTERPCDWGREGNLACSLFPPCSDRVGKEAKRDAGRLVFEASLRRRLDKEQWAPLLSKTASVPLLWTTGRGRRIRTLGTGAGEELGGNPTRQISHPPPPPPCLHRSKDLTRSHRRRRMIQPCVDGCARKRAKAPKVGIAHTHLVVDPTLGAVKALAFFPRYHLLRRWRETTRVHIPL